VWIYGLVLQRKEIKARINTNNLDLFPFFKLFIPDSHEEGKNSGNSLSDAGFFLIIFEILFRFLKTVR